MSKVDGILHMVVSKVAFDAAKQTGVIHYSGDASPFHTIKIRIGYGGTEMTRKIKSHTAGAWVYFEEEE